MDNKAAEAAKKSGLPKSAEKLTEKVSKKDFPRLLAAIIRADLNRDYDLKKEQEAPTDDLSQKTKKELAEALQE